MSSSGSLQFKSSSYSVAEGNGNIRIYVSRTGGSYGAASVSYATANGTALAGSDYTAKSSTLSWSDGDTADKYFDVAIIDDSTPENDETFTISLSGATGATLGNPSQTTVTIPLNDQLTGSLQFKSLTYSTAENAGSVRIYVSRTGGSYGAASVSYATANGTALAGSDYTAKSGTLSWTDGDSVDKYFDVSILDDNAPEINEFFRIILSETSGASLGSPSSTLVTIPLNDQLTGSLQFKSLTYSTAENAGSVRIYVSRTGGSYGTASVNYATANGTATAGSDYTAKSGTLTWTDGDSADKYFDVLITDDSIPENNETFTVNLSGATGATLGSPSQTTVTIPLNDQLTGSLQFKSSTYTAAEDAGSVRIYVSRTGGSYGTASVNYATANGTATAGSDYTAKSGTLSWTDGDSADKYFDVLINDDSTPENDEAFTVSLSGATGASMGNPSQITVTITAQDTFTGILTIQKCTVKAGKIQSTDSIQFLGLLDAAETDLQDANDIIIHVDANDMSQPLDLTFQINDVSFKKGKFFARHINSYLRFDTKTGKMTFSAKNVDLTGLACPITVTVTIGDYSAQAELDEAVVNGTKSCPIQLLQGVKNTLDVIKSQFRPGKTAGTDSLTVSGTFTVVGDYIKAPLAITVGEQMFSVPADRINDSRGIISCNAVSNEGPLVTARLDYDNCTYTVSIKNMNLSQGGFVDFGLDCFDVSQQIPKVISTGMHVLEDLTRQNVPGSSWTYKTYYTANVMGYKNSGTMTSNIYVEDYLQNINGHLCNVITSSVGTEEMSMARYADSTGTYAVSWGTFTDIGGFNVDFSSDFLYAPKVLCIGQVFTDTGSFEGIYNFDDDSVDVSDFGGTAANSLKLIGYETIAVPYGKYMAVKSQQDLVLSGSMHLVIPVEGYDGIVKFSCRCKQVLWSNEEVGVLKQIDTMAIKLSIPGYGNITTTISQTSELTAANTAK